jgi:transposase
MFFCMGNPAGVKRDFDALEQRRLKGFALLKQGIHQAEVARQVGVHRQSVSRWAKQIEKAGRAGLKKAGRAGRKPRLTEADLKTIERELKRGPQALGYETDLWTLPRVADLIEQRCGVRFTVGHVWGLLGKLGWSCQRPVGRALQRDETSIEHWKKKRWPKLKKKPSGRGAR